MSVSVLFEDVIGHAAALRLLTRWLQRPAPGYVLLGPSQLGKHHIAERFLAGLLECSASEVLTHPDVVTLDVEEGKTEISVERVRDVRGRLAERPLRARRMVAYVPHLDRLNEEGANALLKVLEEPPAGAVFVCVAEAVSRLPATLLSRFVCLRLGPVAYQDIVQELTRRGFSEDQARQRAQQAKGRPGRALGEVAMVSPYCAEFWRAKNCGQRFEIIERMSKECDSTEDGIDAWKRHLDAWEEYTSTCCPLDPRATLVIGQAIATARRYIGGALSPRLPLEAAAMRLATEDPLRQLLPTMLSSPYPAIFH